jgi:glucokinase
MKRLAIGLDIGGTKIRGVLFDGRNVLHRKEYLYRKKPPTKKEFFTALFYITDTLIANTSSRHEKHTLQGIGVGTAGRVVGNKVLPGPNLTAVEGTAVSKRLKARYRLPVKIANDVKTAALAEWQMGAAKNKHSMVMITLGSGLGGAYIKDGEIQQGAFSSAYEMGFIIIDAGRARAGKRGDFEWFCSEKFFLSRGFDPIDAEQKARAGNAKFRRLWQEFGEYLGIGVASIINVLEPEVFVIGGGISHAWPLFAPAMRKIVRGLALSPTKIIRAKLGRDAGAIGAALLIHNRS